MATLVLGTVGRIFGGPLGGIVGTALGGVVDRGIFGGGGKAREVGRIGNLAIQSAAYGEPIPFVAGRMRVAGNLVWSSGIAEMATRSGGGKRSGPATTSYSYSASFAVGLVGRQIMAVGRIWADGKLIRDEAGGFFSPVTMRLYTGSEVQPVDPLIAAVEGVGGTPAYRGLAYVVFEDLPLGDFGNRIPNLTFEIVADDAEAVDAGDVIRELATIGGRRLMTVEGRFPPIAGHFSGRSGSVGDAVAALLDMSGAVVAGRAGLVVSGGGGAVERIDDMYCQSRTPGQDGGLDRRKRAAGPGLAGSVEVAFYDTTRDFQPGLQRARRDVSGGTDHQSIACAMTPLQAKSLATGILARSQAARLQARVRLPWRFLALKPGALVSLGDDPIIWRVREARFEAFVLHLDLERTETAPVALSAGDGGRALAFDDQPPGPTTLHLLDLPSMPGDLPVAPRLWVAASGASTAWRRAGLELSVDDGESYERLGLIEGGVRQGVALTVLGDGGVDRWDRFAAVDVELLSEAMWLEGRTPASVLSGSNLALLGDEIIQFAAVEALGPRRFRLSQLLRGRRGSEAAMTQHVAGERFVMLDLAAMLSIDPAVDALGRAYRVRAVAAGDGDAPAVSQHVSGAALRPLSPAHLVLRRVGGDVTATWTRRSRAGFGWLDFVDVPLAEAIEAYRVSVSLAGAVVRTVTVAEPAFTYLEADRLADGGGASVTITVAQLSAVVGPGAPSSKTLIVE